MMIVYNIQESRSREMIIKTKQGSKSWGNVLWEACTAEDWGAWILTMLSLGGRHWRREVSPTRAGDSHGLTTEFYIA